MKMPSATHFSILFAAIGVVSTAEFFLWGSHGHVDLAGLMKIGWACLPSFALAALALTFQRRPVPSLVICMGGAIPTPFVLGWYLDAFGHSAAQRALAFQWIPLYQLIVVGVLFVIALIPFVIGGISPTQPGRQADARDEPATKPKTNERNNVV